MFTIYKYTNVENGKVYIGQTTKTLSERAGSNGSNYKESRRFYNDIIKYSWRSFKPEVLCVVDSEDKADEKERMYIEEYKSYDDDFGYNLEHGGINSFDVGDETKKIISDNARERYKDRTKNPMFGKTHTDETKAKMSSCKTGTNNPMFGTKWNDRQRAFCGTKGKKLNISDERRTALRENMRSVGRTVGLKSVRCIEDDIVFESIVAASNHYNVSKSTLCGHLNGRQLTCASKHFEYVNSM